MNYYIEIILYHILRNTYHRKLSSTIRLFKSEKNLYKTYTSMLKSKQIGQPVEQYSQQTIYTTYRDSSRLP